jgi:hypothetical protein
VLLAAAFVLCNLADSVYEFVASRDASNLAPAVPEAIFLALYSVFIAVHRPRWP